MRHEVGDKVRVRSQEWIDAREKNSAGDVVGDGLYWLRPAMQKHAGEVLTIQYLLDIGGYQLWETPYDWDDWMFDPDYRPEDEATSDADESPAAVAEIVFDEVRPISAEDEPLSAEDAVHAMMDNGEVLYNEHGAGCYWSKTEGRFYTNDPDFPGLNVYVGLFRHRAKPRRYMTQAEARAWADSDDSLGWMARRGESAAWLFPRTLGYSFSMPDYQRARLLSDQSGIDENTIQRFDVEEG
jgi:hypothetical protein